MVKDVDKFDLLNRSAVLVNRTFDLSPDGRGAPRLPGIYFLINDRDQVVYVGQSKNLQHRISDHIKDVNHDFEAFAVWHVEDRSLREVLEAAYIKKFKPRENKRKEWDYLRVSELMRLAYRIRSREE